MHAVTRFIDQSGPVSRSRMLPLVHVTSTSNFRKIIESGRLEPRPCKVLKHEILYCSYGDIVFRPSGDQAYWDSDPPVAMVISPDVLRQDYTFYPVDTGAIDAGRLSSFPSNLRASFKERLRITDWNGHRLRQWIKAAFGGNDQYRYRKTTDWKPSTPDEVSAVQQICAGISVGALPDHLKDDLHVISQVECHLSRPIDLADHVTHLVLPSDGDGHQNLLAPTHAKRFGISYYRGHPVRGNLPQDLVSIVRHQIASNKGIE